jgi:hypothetical protein
MTQQVPPPPSKLREDYLIVGIVLLILGFFCFYGASRINWDYVTTYNDGVNLANPYSISEYPQFGACEYSAKTLVMQSNDFLTVSYPEDTQINGTIRIVLLRRYSLSVTVLASSGYPFADAYVYYKSDQPIDFFVDVVLFAQNIQNVTLSTTMTLNHYETPHWGFFGAGVFLSSLALVPIYKSRKQA